MSVRRFLKTFAIALGFLVTNLGITFGAVYAYAALIAPGHPRGFYHQLAPRIAAWTAPLGGAALFFLLGAVVARRAPEHDAAERVVVTFGVYALVDVGLGATDGASAVMQLQLAVSLFAALFGGLLGVALTTKSRPHTYLALRPE